jgi:hypothetical protein
MASGSIIFDDGLRENLETMRLDVGLQEFLGVHFDWDKNDVSFFCNELSDGNILGVSRNSTLAMQMVARPRNSLQKATWN